MRRKRVGKWRPFVSFVTPLTFICGIFAAVYFCYRAALLAVPAVSFEQHLLGPIKQDQVVCGKDEDKQLIDPSPILSTKYQDYIESQTATPNLVTNADLKKLDPVSELPIGYTQNIPAEIGTFEYLQDVSDKQLFLRVTNHSKATDQVPLWMVNPVSIKDDQTYAYSFSYRSNIPVEVALETIDNNTSAYRHVVILKPTSTWQNVTAHFHNADDAAAFRVLLKGQGSGYVDSRNFDIHEITNARLSGGIVTVAFDDGWQSVQDGALPLLEKYSIRTTQYIISEVAERSIREYMDMGVLTKLRQSGHEIGSHSLRHCNQTALSEDELKQNAAKSKQILERRGLGPIRSFAYPLGQYNEVTQAVYSRQYPLIRTSDVGYNDRYFDETNIKSMSVTSTTSEQEFGAWLEHTKKHRLWLVVAYHRVDETGKYSVTKQQLERQLQMIKGSGLKVLPMSEAADLVRK